MVKYIFILMVFLFQASNLYPQEYDHYNYWIYTGTKIKVAWDTFPDVIEHEVELFHVEQKAVVVIGRTPLTEIELTCPRSGHYFVRVRSSYLQTLGYISVKNGVGGYAEYTFNISESGTYFIWGKVLAPHGGANSFYISTDNGSDVKWHLPVSTNWIWVKAVSIDFLPGQHTIIVKQREKWAQLDKILITSSPDVYQDPVDDTVLPHPVLFEAETGVLREPMESAESIQVVWSAWSESSNKDYAAVNSEPRSWWIYSRVAPPSEAIID